MSATAELSQGTISYTDRGSGRPIVFVHGVLVDGALWDPVIAELGEGQRSIAPNLPLGSHRTAMKPDADLSPPGLAKLVADFLGALDLQDVTLVGNDTGGAVSQLVATRHPERIGRLVLTNCDAFEHFPPRAFAYLKALPRVPGAMWTTAQSMRLGAMQRSPLAYGMLAKRRIDRALLDSWTEPLRADAGVRRDTAKVLRGFSKRYTLEAAERLRSFDRPTLIAWGRDDRFFKAADAERLAKTIPNARLEWVDDARTFVSIDQPGRLSELLEGFTS
jgi:pimeloyl-ACP methyl ester carboxylesterase